MFNLTEPEPFPIAVINLELEDQIEVINIYQEDDIEEAVKKFCQYKGLEQQYVNYLIDQIYQQLDKEPTFRIQDSFSQNLKPYRQSEVFHTTKASSVEENSAQKSYEKWQQILNKKADLKQLLNNNSNTVQWTLPNTARSFNENKKITTNERLYRDGLEIQRSKNEKAETLKIQKLVQESIQATFKPLISPRSKLITQQKKRIFKPENNVTEDSFKVQQKSQESSKLQNKTQIYTQQRQESPSQTNKQMNKSKNLTPNKSVTPIYERLFNQAEEGRKKKEEFANQQFQKIHTFRPQISRPTTSIGPQNQKDLVQKLVQEQVQKNQRIEKRKQQMQMQNQPTFHPKIIKDQTYIKVSKQRDYEDSQLAIDLQKLQSHLGSKQSFRSVETRAQSQQSQQKLFDAQLNKTFILLDGDRDGQISKDKIDLQNLDIDTIEIIKDVLYFIDDQNIKVDLTQFKKICNTYGLYDKFNKS